MSTYLFATAVLALLLAPGPTNTLMGLAGAEGGIARVTRLLPAELSGYLTAILPLIYVGERVLSQWPLAAAALKIAAAAWVMVLAVSLWQAHRRQAASREVSGRRIFLTTMLNPKALVFALVLLPPPGDGQFLPHLCLFCLLVVVAALLWGAAGAMTRAGTASPRRLRYVQRAASIWLGFVSVSLVVGLAAS